MRQGKYTIILIIFFFGSCTISRDLPENKYIVNKVKIEVKGQYLASGKLRRYIQQPGMRKILGLPIYAYIYNIPNPAKDLQRLKRKKERLEKRVRKIERRYDLATARVQAKRNKYFSLYQKYLNVDSAKALNFYQKYVYYNKKLEERKKQRPEYITQAKQQDIFTWWEFVRNLGEKPPVYNPYLAQKSAQYIKNYLMSLGYYNATVVIKTYTKGKKINIHYIVYPGKQLIIDSVSYQIQDTNIAKIIEQNPELKLMPGTPLAIKFLKQYRNTIVNSLKELGYYYFTKDYISFAVDTNNLGGKAKLYVNISAQTDREGNILPHRRFKIRDVYIYTDYEPNLALENPDQYFSQCDTSIFFKQDTNKYYFIRRNSFIIKPKYILKEIYITPGDLYKFSDVRNTYLHLSKFSIYKLVNIDFTDISDSLNNLLDCKIYLTPAKSQTITAEIVGTNSSATIGGAFNLTYRNRNLFGGGEIFSLKMKLALESQKFYLGNFSIDSLFNFNTQEYGIDAQLTIPRLLLPFSISEFVERNNPKTVMQLNYNFQDRPEYNRIDLTLIWSYYWRANLYTNHIFAPLRVSSVRVWDLLPEFVELLSQTYLLQSYENYFILGTTYSFTFSNQGEDRPNTVFLQFNLSSSGNLLYELMRLTNQPMIDGSYYMPGFKTNFAQFVKADVDLRFYHNVQLNSRLVWRLFIGVGVPFLNSKLLPFGERYFIGGSNSIRAWQARTLGPGSYRLPAEIRYPNQTGDIRLEMNLEYRYPLFWKLEGAVFLDAGNIWAINKYDVREGALFQWNTFYKQIAVGSGFGLRVNFNFFVVRLDLGVKLYDPAAEIGFRFIPASRPFNSSDFTVNIAIGYPF